MASSSVDTINMGQKLVVAGLLFVCSNLKIHGVRRGWLTYLVFPASRLLRTICRRGCTVPPPHEPSAYSAEPAAPVVEEAHDQSIHCVRSDLRAIDRPSGGVLARIQRVCSSNPLLIAGANADIMMNRYIMTHEAFIYVFDGLVMLIAVIIMNWIHPGEVAQEVRAAKSGRVQVHSSDKEEGTRSNMMGA